MTLRVIRGLIAVLATQMIPQVGAAQQVESPIPCDESPAGIQLVYGDHTTGCIIANAVDLDQFTFDAEAGDFVRIHVQALANFLDPRLEIRDPLGTVILDTFCVDSCTYAVEPPDYNPPLESLNQGTYTLTISDQGSNDTGTYSLQLELIPPVGAAPELLYDVGISDTISPSTDIDFLSFQGIAGTEIRLVVHALSNFLDPRLEIWDPDGIKIEDTFCTDSCSFTREPSQFSEVPSVALTKTGSYLVALSDLSINDTGAYGINVHCLVGACDPVEPPNVSFVSASGASIDSVTDMDFYTFEAPAGVPIRIAVQALSNFLDPRLEIWDPDGIKIEDTFCPDSCTLTRDTSQFSLEPSAALPKTGLYRLAISDQSNNDTGGYGFNIHCLLVDALDLGNTSLRCDSDADGVLDPLPKKLTYSAIRNGTIAPSTDLDLVAFNGVAGTDIRIALSALSNFLDPRLEIWAPDGTKLDDMFCADSCSFTREPSQFSLAPSPTLPATGTYVIAISDVSVNDTGSYTLGLNCLFGACADDPLYPPDFGDNCVDIPNAAPLNCDGDMDGYGNMCDADLDNNASQDAGDIDPFIAALMSQDPIGDIDCNGSTDAGDIGPFLDLLESSAAPGPGLACAGTIPCPGTD